MVFGADLRERVVPAGITKPKRSRDPAFSAGPQRTELQPLRHPLNRGVPEVQLQGTVMKIPAQRESSHPSSCTFPEVPPRSGLARDLTPGPGRYLQKLTLLASRGVPSARPAVGCHLQGGACHSCCSAWRQLRGESPGCDSHPQEGGDRVKVLTSH